MPTKATPTPVEALMPSNENSVWDFVLLIIAIPPTIDANASPKVTTMRVWGGIAARQSVIARGKRSSFARVSEIVELCNTIGFGPDADFASILKGVVFPFERLLSVERDCEMIPIEIDTQRVPLVGCDVHVRSLLFRALAFDRVVNRNVVFESVGARNVVIVRVLEPPDNAARLIFLASDWLELHFDESVFDTRVVPKTNWESRLT